jgi:signal transduction histidine kinase/ligand-binding sensor domain-containing protein
MLKHIVFFISLIFVTPVFSKVAFYHYGIEKGLPEALILSISQDSTGFIWLAGENTLFRFDGTNFKAYRENNKDGAVFPAGKINLVFTDSNGKLWLGTENGIAQYSFSNDIFNSLKDWERVHVTDISEDSEKQLWIATDEGLACLNLQTNKTTWYTGKDTIKVAENAVLPISSIGQVTCQPDGKIWFTSKNGGLYRFNPGTGKTEDFGAINETNLANYDISEIKFSGDQLFISTLSNGFLWFNPDKKIINKQVFDHFGYTIHHFQISGDSSAWLASNNGLIHFNFIKGHYTRNINEPNNPLSLNRTAVDFIYLDKQNNLWATSGIRGLNYGLINVQFDHYLIAEEGAYQLTHKEVTAVEFDTRGSMWLGYEAGILEKHSKKPLEKKRFQLKSESLGGNVGSIMKIFEDSQNRLWIGGWLCGLQKLNNAGTSFEFVTVSPDTLTKQLITADIRGITEDRQGNIWVSLHGKGIGCYNPKTNNLKIYRHDPANPFTSISNDFTYNLVIDRENNVWVASAHGVTRFNIETSEFSTFFHEDNNPNSLSSNTINTVYCDHSGVIWVGTNNGLNAFIKESNTFQPVFTDQDYPYLNISDIQSVKHGELWVSSQTGIFRVNYSWLNDNKKIDIKTHLFDRSQGLLSTNFLPRSSSKNSEGLIFFGGNEGIDFLDPNDFSVLNNLTSEIILTDILVDGKRVSIQDLNESGETGKLIMDHSDRMLSIRFTSLRFNSPGRQVYRFRLEGFDDEWNYPQNEQVATFTNLKPGDYVFSVEAQGNNGAWENQPVSLIIKIKTPFWMTIPFLIATVILMLVLIYLYSWARSRVLLAQQKELERIIKERTSELVQKNHELEEANQTKNKFFSIVSHDLMSPFSGVLGLMQLLTDQEYKLDSKRQMEILKLAKDSVENTYELMENLLTWARSQMKKTECNPQINDIYTLLRKNIELKSIAAKQKEIIIHENFNGRREAFFDSNMVDTVIRNLLSNAVKFTNNGGKIEVSSDILNGDVIISIADNGIGLNKSEAEKLFDINKETRTGTKGEKGTGLGLIVCKEFIEKNNGKIWATANVPRGTVIHFSIPLRLQKMN